MSHINTTCMCPGGLIQKIYSCLHRDSPLSPQQHWMIEKKLKNLVESGKIATCKCIDTLSADQLSENLTEAYHQPVKLKDGTKVPFGKSPCMLILNQLDAIATGDNDSDPPPPDPAAPAAPKAQAGGRSKGTVRRKKTTKHTRSRIAMKK